MSPVTHHGGLPSDKDEQPESVRVRVPAKINLALCVAPLGSDGYHRLGTVFQAISLFDDITATACVHDIEVTVAGEGAEQVPLDATNLAVRAALLLRERFGWSDLGVRLRLKKSIPVAGGMAGGSADAAGALLACSVLWDLDTSPEDLHDLAAELGSDCAFPLLGGTAIGRGRGEQLVPLLTRGTYHWVVALADTGLSTGGVYGRFDEIGGGAEADRIPGPDADPEIPPALLNALAAGNAGDLGAALRNDLQLAALDLRPELGGVLEAGMSLGAIGAMVSGSGPTCVFLAPNETAALDLAAALGSVPHVRSTRKAVGQVPGARLWS